MDFKQRYINEEILQGIVIPFYKKHFPNMYDDSLNIVVELFDNVPKDKQKISSDKKDTTIHYDTVGKVDDIDDIGEQYINIGEQMGIECNLQCRRKVLDAIILVHECAHQYTEKKLWKNNDSYNSFNRIKEKVQEGKFNVETIGNLQNIISNYGIIDLGETVAKSAELALIDKLFEDGQITEHEKNNCLEFQKKWSQKLFNEGNALYNLYSKEGEEKFSELVSKYDFFSAYSIRKDDNDSYLDYLKNPLGYMEKMSINIDRKNDSENINWIVQNTQISKINNFKQSLSSLVNDDEIYEESIKNEDINEKNKGNINMEIKDTLR